MHIYSGSQPGSTRDADGFVDDGLHTWILEIIYRFKKIFINYRCYWHALR